MSLLTVRHLTKSYGEIKAVNDVSISVEKGEIVGFVGANGSGKTTVLKCITGLVKQDQGEVWINDIDIHKDFERAVSKVGALIEMPALYPHLSGYENIQLSARVYRPSEAYLDELLRFTGLEQYLHRPVAKYSLGMKQRLAICIALLSKPELLLLDEPMNGLDVEGVAEFRRFICDLARKNGTAVLISSHILSELQKMCDRVIFIKKGILKGIVEAKDMKEDLEEVYFEQGEV